MTNVPEIRFKGFTDAWEQRRLGEVAETLDYGLNAAATDFDGVNKYIRITDIDDESRTFKEDNVTSPDCDIAACENYKLQDGDILFARTGASVGKTYRYLVGDGLVYFAGFLIRARLINDFDTDFVYQNTLTKKYGNFIKIMSQRSGQPGVNAQEYADFSLGIPCSKEQQRLGNFFRALDNTIAIHKRKLDCLRKLKKAYLQVLFPQVGEVVPRLRFAGFTEPWEIKGANEIFCTISDKGYSHLPVLSASQEHGMILRNEIGIDIKFDSTNTATYKRVLPGQFVIHLRSFQGGLAYSKIEGITSPAYTILDFIDEDKQVPGFWVDVLRSDNFIKTLESVTYGIRDGRSISFNDFSILKMPYPSYYEQKTIGRFFQSFDNNIDDLQSKVNALSKLKSAYLQKMFV